MTDVSLKDIGYTPEHAKELEREVKKMNQEGNTGIYISGSTGALKKVDADQG